MLTGKVALITGGSGGIGSAICRELAQAGAQIAIHCFQRRDEAAALTQELPEAIFFQADLLQPDTAPQLMAACLGHFGRLDILVNNAGWTRAVPEQDLEALDAELMEKTLRLKLHVPLELVRAGRLHLQHSRGCVVNITSVAGIAARGNSIIYSAANAGLANLTRSLARALAPEIRVNAVAPGFVDTGFAWPVDGSQRAHVAGRNHIGRTIEPAEVAAAVRFLCESPGITGEEIAVDGGIARLGTR
ncbi:MAG: SDR family NAD(P)-dependent oxidoreductase [Candidatus Sericytochromatia bacterium]